MIPTVELLEELQESLWHPRGQVLVEEIRRLIVPPPMPYLGIPRAASWDKFAIDCIAAHPFCSACGGTELLQAHHIVPFHEAPELELVESNILVLCMAPWRHCHFVLGHAWNWQDINPEVRAMAAKMLKLVNKRKMLLTR